MLRAKWVVGALVGLGAIAIVAGPVYAHCGKCAASAKQMIKQMDESKLTLAKAVELAEKESKGRAVKAVCEIDEGTLEVEVYCLVGDKLMEVEIDAKKGKVSEMEEVKTLTEDEAEEHEEHEEEDDD